MADNGTKELARQMALMVEVPEVKADIKRVAAKLEAFRQTKSGQVVRSEPKKAIAKSGTSERGS